MAWRSRDERGTVKAAKQFYYSPSDNPPYGVLPAPSTGRLLVRFISLHIKPALKGEVDFAKQKPEGLKKERGFACYRQPLSQTFGLPAPRKGEPYEERITLLAQASFFDAEIHRRNCVGEKSQTFSLFRR